MIAQCDNKIIILIESLLFCCCFLFFWGVLLSFLGGGWEGVCRNGSKEVTEL